MTPTESRLLDGKPLVIEAEVLLGQVYSLDDDETDTQFHWSVTLALRLGKQNHRLQTFLLSEAGMTPERILQSYPDLDEVYALNTDLSKPLVFVSLRGKDVLIDGWHRLYLASLTGVDELLAYFLTEDEGNECLLFRLPRERAIHWGQRSSEQTETDEPTERKSS